VRAVAAANALDVRLLKKFAQRPLMSVWEGEVDQPGEIDEVVPKRKRVALTVVDASGTPEERKRVLQAARALVAIYEGAGESPDAAGVQRIYRVADEADAFVSDLCSTGTAADLSVLRWQMSRKLEFARKVAASIATMNAAGLVHGCMCPENVRLDDEFGPVMTEAAMVSIAESLEGDRENFFGYGAYAAPEACEPGPIDARADVYSLGRLLVFLVLDREPAATEGDTADADLDEVAAKVPGLVPIIRRATKAKPAERYAGMADVQAELERCVREYAPPERDSITSGRRTGSANNPAIAAAQAAAGRRTGPGTNPAVAAAQAAAGRRTGSAANPAIAAAQASAGRRTNPTPEPAAAAGPQSQRRPPSGATAGRPQPAPAPRREEAAASPSADHDGSLREPAGGPRWATPAGLIVFVVALVASAAMSPLSGPVGKGLLAGAAVGLALAALGVPVRSLVVRLVLVLAAVGVVVGLDPVARIAGTASAAPSTTAPATATP